MQVNELLKTYNFHDSNVIKLIHENNTVIIKLDLCMWKQKGYQKGDLDLKEISLKFDPINHYIWDSKKAEKEIDYDTILDVSYYKDVLKMVLSDDEISIMSFRCSTVSFI